MHVLAFLMSLVAMPISSPYLLISSPFFDVPHSNFVAIGNIANHGNGFSVAFFVADLNFGTIGNAIGKNGGDVIFIVDFQRQLYFHYAHSPFAFFLLVPVLPVIP